MYAMWLWTYEGEDAKTHWKDLFALKLMERGELLILEEGFFCCIPLMNGVAFS